MAKNSRGGLGRGLSSLMGGPLETSAQRTSNRERVEYDEDFDYTTQDVSRETSKPTQTTQEIPVVKEVAQQEKAQPSSAAEVTPQVETPKAAASAEKAETDGVLEVAITEVEANPDQPRTNFKQEELDELAKSIEQDGLLQPVLVRMGDDGKYQIIAGERRWQASKLAGLERIPIRITEADDDRALELALIENLQRSDLNPIEEAYGYKRLMDRKRMTQADIAQAMSKGRSTIANALRLLDLPEEAQQLLFEEKITAGHARAILSVPSTEGREKLTERLQEKKLSVRETESLARLMSMKPGERKAKEPVPQTYRQVAKALKDVLKTPVKVKSSNGKNKIEIEFTDEEDLRRVFDELVSTVSEK